MAWEFLVIQVLIKMWEKLLRVYSQTTTRLIFQILVRTSQTIARSFNKKWPKWLKIKSVLLSKVVEQLICRVKWIVGRTQGVSKGEVVLMSRILTWVSINTKVALWISSNQTAWQDKWWHSRTTALQSMQTKVKNSNSTIQNTINLNQLPNQWDHPLL